MHAKPAASVILVRCHVVDDALLDLARKLNACPAYDVVLAIDARAHVPPHCEFALLRTGKSIYETELGLFCPDDVLWRCGDYALFLARRKWRDYRFYWMIEYDVHIARADVASFFCEIDGKSAHDLVCAQFRATAQADWWWVKYLNHTYANVARSFFPLVRLTGAALDHLYAARRAFYARNASLFDQAPFAWPNDEVFTATELVASGFACADFNDLGSVYYTLDGFDFETLRHPCECGEVAGELFHPVRRGLAFARAARKLHRDWDGLTRTLLGETRDADEFAEMAEQIVEDRLETEWDRPQRLFAPGGALATLLALRPDATTLRLLTKAFARFRMPACLDHLRDLVRRGGWPAPDRLHDVALARPAAQSSVCEWSNHPHPPLDAAGANDGDDAKPYGFHTDRQNRPWWRVDLQSVYDIRKIAVSNRTAPEHAERLRGFVILASADDEAWREVYRHGAGDSVGPEIEIAFPLGVEARFLRVELPRNGILHFRQIQVFANRAETRESNTKTRARASARKQKML